MFPEWDRILGMQFILCTLGMVNLNGICLHFSSFHSPPTQPLLREYTSSGSAVQESSEWSSNITSILMESAVIGNCEVVTFYHVFVLSCPPPFPHRHASSPLLTISILPYNATWYLLTSTGNRKIMHDIVK